ncbi:cobyrinate a,c-diamide synthase [Granulicella sibirica]|uniref:Cobyrinate a,c-diamide synthase n=1 Tax=Granulicella sibirica TaxID=2479048 RepID=A0A4Q0T5R4_9BACT|nr:cobyrinate a,c-diamide synthase [Granulicella sibirica]RXH56921.1 Cobyrinic acid A,C-diamide synthase [Granulicella sibirica]
MKGFLVAGTASGVGKTTVTLALIAATRQRGLVVQPFKGGPDFLDTTHHTRISGSTSRNLDTWMLTPEANRAVLSEASAGADAVIVEGMMGLFDGKDGLTETGSSAEIAKLLGLPVILVLDASKSARSIAAVVLGFESFDLTLNLAGVILNRAASERHYQMLSTAIAASCRTPVLGWLPRDPAITIPERHLGLHAASEAPATEVLSLFAEAAEAHLELDRILALEFPLEARQSTSSETKTDPIRIGVARDDAFSFYYEDNLDLLRNAGATIISFSPLHDPHLPEDLDALYLGGGYPELHAEALSANTSMHENLRTFAAQGRPIYAECGGMIYLGRTLTTTDGEPHAMANLLDLAFEMTPKLNQFGYTTVELTQSNLLGPAGTVIRGHSFHYSRLTSPAPQKTSYEVTYSLASRKEPEGFTQGNILASYIHLHFRANPTIAPHFVEAARTARLVHA